MTSLINWMEKNNIKTLESAIDALEDEAFLAESGTLPSVAEDLHYLAKNILKRGEFYITAICNKGGRPRYLAYANKKTACSHALHNGEGTLLLYSCVIYIRTGAAVVSYRVSGSGKQFKATV